MNLAVLLYAYVVDKPIGMPDNWPCEVRELGEGVTVPGPNWQLMTSEQLQSWKNLHNASYEAWRLANATPSQTAVVNNIIAQARAFGESLILEAARDNILMGIAQAGKTRAVADYCQKLMNYLQSGSLYAAIEEINAMINDLTRPLLNLSPFITTERLIAFRTKIQAYLGIA